MKYLIPFFLTFSFSITTDELLSRLQEKEKEIKDIEFEYVQLIHFALTDETNIIYASLKFKKPDKLLINFMRPEEQILLADRKSISIYYPSKRKLLTLNWEDLSSYFPILPSFFPYSIKTVDLKKKYKLDLSEDEKFYFLNLRPKSKKLKDHVLKLHINKVDCIPVEIEISSKEYKTSLKLEKYSVNKGFDDNVFQLSLPDDVERIKLYEHPE